MKELKIIPIINLKEENNNENYENNEIDYYKYLNNIDTLIDEENKENNIHFNDITKIKILHFTKIVSFLFQIFYHICTSLSFLNILSLEGYYKGEDECSIKMKWIYQKVIEEIISCIFLVIAVQLMIFTFISRLHLIHLVIIFPLFYINSHGLEFPDHGFINFFYSFFCFYTLNDNNSTFNYYYILD